jgi:hypothetical protein
MHHVKSEHEKDEDDDLDDDRKPELGHHGHHSYYQHPMAMGGHYNSHHHHHSLKTEIDTISKNQTGSDCGVPIPASKPKIWSLADTAACKTPPPHLHPNAGAWGYQTAHQHPSQQYSSHSESPTLNHQHQMHRQHPQSQYQQQQMQQQQQHMGMNMGANGVETASVAAVAAGMNMNMITSGHHNQSMSGMMNTFGGSSPYSRYGGFLTTGTHPTQQQAAQQMPQAQQQYINHSHTGGSTTPVTPNSNTGQPTTPTLLQQQTNTNQTSNNQTMGFPEVQTGKRL